MKMSEALRRAAETEAPLEGNALNLNGQVCALGYLGIRAGVHFHPPLAFIESARADSWRSVCSSKWFNMNHFVNWSHPEARKTIAAFYDCPSDALDVEWVNPKSVTTLIWSAFDKACRAYTAGEPDAINPFLAAAIALEGKGL